MSKTVDERIVSMQFDNKEFEKNVSTTMKSLDELDKSLQLKDASRGIETVRSKFSALQVMAVTALANITNSAVNAGKRIVASLTIDPIKTGLAEYETQLNSVQTILANTKSKGSTLDDVNSALDELNAYADKTIYNFTEMTRNIGTFTAAGVDLDTSVSAIKGIANLAAVSGSTSQQASTAMYQLSQALASGTVKLMDWNSVVNAGMGGQVFQDELKATARAHGIAIDDIIKKNGSFRESLQEGWLSSEILTETLAKFTGDLSEEQLKSMGYTEEQIKGIMELGKTANDAATKVKTFTQLLDTLKEAAQSGWAQTWELVFGDFEEAKEFWTKVSDEIGGLIVDSAERRNKLLSGTLSSGFDNFINDGIGANAVGYKNWIKTVAKGHNVAIDDMVKKYGSLDKAIDAGIKDGIISHEMLSEALARLTDDRKNLSDQELKNLGITREQIDALTEFNNKIQNGEASIEDYYSKMQRLSGRELLFNIEYDDKGLIKYNENTGALVNLYGALLSVVKPIKEAFREIFPATTSEQLYGILEAFRKFTQHLILSEEQSEKLKNTFKGLFAILDVAWKVIKDVAGAIFELFGYASDAGGSFLDFTSSLGDLLMRFRDFIKETSIVSMILGGLISTIKKIIDLFGQFFSAIGEFMSSSGFLSFANVFKAIWNTIYKVIKAISKALGSLFGNITSGDFSFILDTMSSGVFLVAMIKLKDAFSTLGKAGGSFIEGLKEIGSNFVGILDDVRETLKAFQAQIKSKIIMNIAIALGVLTASVLVLSMLDPEKISNALGALVIMFTGLMGALSIYGKMTKDGGLKNAIASTILINIAKSLLIMALALKLVSSMSWSQIMSGLTAMAGAMGILLGALKTLEYIKIDKKSVKQVKKLASMLITLGIALKIMGSMSWGEVGRSLAAMAGAMSILIGALALTAQVSKIGDNKVVGKINKLSRMLIVLGLGLKILATMSWDDIGRALSAMSGALSIMIGALALTALITKIGDNKAINKIMLMSLTMVALSLALKIMSTMGWNGVAQSLTAMAGALTILVGTTAIMSKIQNGGKALVNALALTIMVGAMVVLAGALAAMGAMKWENIGRALTAMAGAMVVLVGALAVMSKVQNGIGTLGFAAAILIIVVAINMLVPALSLLGSLSIGTIAAGLITMAAALAIFGVAAVALSSYTGAIMAFGMAILFFGAAVMAIGVGIGVLAAGIATLITAIVAGGAALVATITSLVKSLIELLPFLFTKLGEALVAFCGIITDGAPAIGEAIVAVIFMVIDLLLQVVPKLAEGIVKLILSLLEILSQYTPQVVSAIFNLIIGIIKSIGEYIPDFIQTCVDLMMQVFQGLIDALKTIDKDVLVNGIMAVGLITALMLALSLISALVPSAMMGCIGAGLVIAELALVLAAIGALARIPGLTEIVADSGALLGAIGKAIGSFIGGIAGGFAAEASGALPTLGANLSAFMVNLQPFIEGMKQLDAKVLAAAGILTGIIVALTATSIIEALTSFITGGVDLAGFGKQLGGFGEGVKLFADKVKGVDPETVKAAAEAGKNLGEMARAIPTSGGLWDLIAGKNDLKGFSKQLGGFGEGVKAFADKVKGVNPEEVKSAAEAGKSLAEMAKKVPTSGGLWDLIAGKNDLSGFASQLGHFGSAIAKFATTTGGVSMEAVQNGVSAAKLIIDMTKNISKSGGFWQMIIGEIDMGKLAKQLGKFGTAIVNFVNVVNSIGDVNKTVAIVNTLNASLRDFSSTGIKSFMDSFKVAKADLSNVVSEMVNSAINAVENKMDKFKSVAEKFMDKFIDAIKKYKPKIKKELQNTINEVVASINTRTNYDSFYNAGAYLVQGMANGISKHMGWVKEAARKMARSASDAAKEELDEHSPSRVGYEIGDFFGVAFVNAITEYGDKAYNAGSNMADSAKSGLNQAISNISSMIENDMDAQPTIRPVLDLSAIASGANAINGMFGMSPSVGVMSKVNAISSSMNSVQNGGNEDVISAIDKLENTIKNASGDTYNINGITYDDGSALQSAIETIVRATIRERRR